MTASSSPTITKRVWFSLPAPQKASTTLECESPPGEKNPTWVQLSTPTEFQDLSPTGVLKGQFTQWKGYFRRSGAGWAHARDAMVSGAREAQRLGVQFVIGSPQGRVVALVYEEGDVEGAMAADGTIWRAEQTFLCAGANADQLRPTAWTLVHLTLAPEERALYKNLPVIFNSERGFFFEPNEVGEIKVCDGHPGYTNMVQSEDGSVSSIPFERTQVPRESEERVRALLRETMPQLADRPFSFARICWCADTPHREFIVDRHPAHPSLILGCGASEEVSGVELAFVGKGRLMRSSPIWLQTSSEHWQSYC